MYPEIITVIGILCLVVGLFVYLNTWITQHIWMDTSTGFKLEYAPDFIMEKLNTTILNNEELLNSVLIDTPILDDKTKAALQSLENLEFQLVLREVAIQFARDPIIVTQIDLDPAKVKILLANKAYCDLVGFTEKELVGFPAKDVLAGPETNLDGWVYTNTQLLNKQCVVGSGILYLKTGPQLVEWSTAPLSIRHDNKQVTCAVSILRCI